MENNEEKDMLEQVEGTGYIEQVEIDHEMRTAYRFPPVKLMIGSILSPRAAKRRVSSSSRAIVISALNPPVRPTLMCLWTRAPVTFPWKA